LKVEVKGEEIESPMCVSGNDSEKEEARAMKDGGLWDPKWWRQRKS